MESGIISQIGLQEMIGVIIRTSVIFIYAFILLRLLGKRRLVHFGYMDLLLVIAFGSAVGDVMIYSESTVHLVAAMVSITVVSIIVKMLNEISARSPVGNHLLDGHARILIDKGTVVTESLVKENMTEEQLLSYIREKGADSIKKVRKAFIEPDGEISVIQYKNKA